MTTETTTVMGTAAGYDCIDMLAVSNDEAATNKSTEDARIFTAEPGKAIRGLTPPGLNQCESSEMG